MAKFGSCLSGHHRECNQEFEQFYCTGKGQIKFTGQMIQCDCECHQKGKK